jgi:uncharacterized protein YbjT (DUF2867 family)
VKTVLLAGATGLVGKSVLQQALAHPNVARVIAPTRRPLPVHPKLHNPLIDFDALPIEADWWRADAVICALGTTMKQAGSKEAFRKVDLEYPLAIAKIARRHGADAFALNSATGANPQSRVFYSRTKGEIEQAIGDVGFSSVTFVRPGLITGDRETPRAGEKIAEIILTALRPLIPKRYRAVPAERIAHVLLDHALNPAPGCRIVESEQI